MQKDKIKTAYMDEFIQSQGRDEEEIYKFYDLRKKAISSGLYAMETIRFCPPDTIIGIERQTGEKLTVLNFSTYNYFGYATHPSVIKAAKEALDQYGLGCSASPAAGGTLKIQCLSGKSM